MTEGWGGDFDEPQGASPDGDRAGHEPSPKGLGHSVTIPCAWWRCIHCKHDKYEPDDPMVRCASCGALHSQPDPQGPQARRAALREMVEAVEAAMLSGEWEIEMGSAAALALYRARVALGETPQYV
jgi:hypothetical protein